MARDLSDPWAEIRALKERVRILETATPLQDSSVTRGRLRVASEDGFLAEAVPGGGPAVRVTGLQVVDGTLRITGTLEGAGTWTWTGTWNLAGPGTISGNTTGTGTLTWNGLWEMVGAGKIRGDVEVLDNGKLRIGNMVIDPTEGGSIAFPGGAKVQADPNGGVRMIQGNNRAYVGPNLVSLQYGNRSIALSNSAITVQGADESATTTGIDWLGVDGSGKLWRVPQGVGGPTGGPLAWPFPPNTVTDEFGPRPPGSEGQPFHNGIDFGTGGVTTGSPIPAAASGTVTFAGDNGGFGYCVIIDHGGSPNLKTLYAHMDTMPLVSVGQHVNRGDILGPVGNTGASFGAHLHFEVHVDGVPVNPRSKLPQQV